MKNDRTDKGRRLEFLSSIRTRIFLVSLVIGLAPCLFLQRGILENYERRAVGVQTGQAQTQLRAIANHLILSDYMNDSQSDLIDAELAEFSSIYDGRLLVIDSSLNIIKDTYSVSDGRVIISELVTDCLRTSTTKVSNYQSGDSYILIAMPITETLSLESGDHSGEPQPTESGATQGVLLASVSTENILTTLDLLTRSALLMELIIVVIIIVLSFVFSILLVTPFEKLSQSIAKVRAGFSSRPVSAPEYLETRHIAEAFNVVLGRMNALDASRQEFVSNVSHELKTPMASMKVLADVLMSQEHAPEEMYREFLQDICHEIDRENNIIQELLTLVRMDRTDIALKVEPVNINDAAEQVMKWVRPIADENDIQLALEHKAQVIAEVDETRLNMIMTNLVENAVKYNRRFGKVTMTIDKDNQYFFITVEDTGIGMAEEELDKIYERFYRVDKSRSREIGGTGLGLSITRSAILLHHGKIDVTSEEGEGTTFTVTIPLVYEPEPDMTGTEQRKGGTGNE